MIPRYLERIDKRIRESSSPLDIGILNGRKAAYLARTGNFEAAVELINQVRSDALQRDLPLVAIFATFVDGLIAFYQDLVDGAHDKWKRARALSEAAGAKQILSNADAWLAHQAFGRFDLTSLEANMLSALRNVSPDDSECLARLFLVIAEAAHLSGDKVLANKWYGQTRYQALVAGDDSTISSLMYNRAAMDVAYYRQRMLCALGDVSDASLAVLAAESTDNFDKLVGVVSLGDFTPILRAQTYSLAGRFSEAENIYKMSLVDQPNKAQWRHRGWLLADRTFCAANLGSMEVAISLAQEAIKYVTIEVQIDDLAALHSRLSLVYSLAGDAVLSKEHGERADESWGKFSELQSKIGALCKVFDSEGGKFTGQ